MPMPSASGRGNALAIDRPEVAQTFAQLYGGDDKLSRVFQQGVTARRQMAADMATMDDKEQMAANKVHGARAALCPDEFTALLDELLSQRG